MVRLIERTPCAGLLPVEVGGLRLEEVVPEAITCIMPLKGKDKAVSAALKKAIGSGFPTPGRSTGKAGARVVWTGAGQAMVLGPRVAFDGAALSDQSDGWACMALEGACAREVLARLMPVDLRPGVFGVGDVARSLLGHMTCVILRAGEDRYEIMAFRSMAKTAVHDIEIAMKSVVAQG